MGKNKKSGNDKNNKKSPLKALFNEKFLTLGMLETQILENYASSDKMDEVLFFNKKKEACSISIKKDTRVSMILPSDYRIIKNGEGELEYKKLQSGDVEYKIKFKLFIRMLECKIAGVDSDYSLTRKGSPSKELVLDKATSFKIIGDKEIIIRR